MVVIPQWLRVLIKCGASIKVWIYIDVIDISTLFKKLYGFKNINYIFKIKTFIENCIEIDDSHVKFDSSTCFFWNFSQIDIQKIVRSLKIFSVHFEPIIILYPNEWI